MGMPRGRAAPI